MVSGSFQPLTTSEDCFVVWTVLNDLNTAHSAVVRSWRELPNNRLIVLKNAFVCWALNFRVCMLIKGAVNNLTTKRFFDAVHLLFNWSQMMSKWGKGQGSFFNCIVKFLAEVYLISSCYVSMTWKRQKKLWLTRKHREMTCKLKRWLGQQSYVLFWLLGEKYEQGQSNCLIVTVVSMVTVQTGSMGIVSIESIKDILVLLRGIRGAEKCRSMVNLGEGPRETTEVLHCCHKMCGQYTGKWPF